LSREVPDLAGEGHQGQVHRVQLQLHRHEDEQRVLADQHADGPDGEQQGGHQQEVGDGGPHGVALPSVAAGARSSEGSSSSGSGGCAGPVAGRSMVGSSAIRRRPWSMAPMAAMISKAEVTSNGKKY